MKVLITGGCGFIGTNAAARFSEWGSEVHLFDNLSRRGADRNLDWIRERHPVHFHYGDVRDDTALDALISAHQFDLLIHLASQVAVTTSVAAPRDDFEINARGTFNVLESIRNQSPTTVIINASTNKVYGKLAGLETRELPTRYQLPVLPHGVAETQPLDFYSPYGCSKGSADQYALDYARIYNLRAVTLRQSCIYGPRQFGVEDQGWVAWFAIAHSQSRAVNIYGTGKQVRDLLHVDDLIACYRAVFDRIDQVSGRAFNVGGGPANTLSILELFDLLATLSETPVRYTLGDWRPGDQPVYISDTRLAAHLLHWTPRIPVNEGVERLWRWVLENQTEFSAALAAAV